jgi:hypothetical protein
MFNQPNQSKQLNLLNLFQSVAGSLTSQRANLNNADPINHDHGDNMVEVFNVISQAMQAKQNADPADQLEYASQLLRQRKSGSAQVYAQGLDQASKEFKGQKQVTPDNAISLIQALLGGGQPSTAQPQSGMGNLLGSLLGGGSTTSQQPQGGMGDLLGSLLGGGSTANQQTGSAGGVGDLLGSLLGGGDTTDQQSQSASGAGDLLGSFLGGGAEPSQSSQNQQASSGLDAGDLLNAGMAFMNAKAQGGNTMQALVSALVSGSAMGNSQHRSQSGALVVNSLLQAISGLTGNK